MPGRIPIANLYYLLCYAWNRLEEDDLVDVRELQGADTANLLAQLLVAAARRTLRRGLNRDYIARVAELRCVRGRLLYAESVRRGLPERGAVLCEYDELESDNLPNRILVASLLLLKDNPSVSERNHEILVSVLREMRSIEPVDLHPSVFRRVRLHRSNAHYGTILSVCELAYGCMMPEPGGGSHRFRSFVEDAKQMAVLFEDFVRNFYAAHAPDSGFTDVGAFFVKWFATAKNPADLALLPRMHTDVSLHSPTRNIIVECKFYPEALHSRYETEKLISANLYQIFAYVKNQSLQKGWTACEGLLLYPAVDGDWQVEYDMAGNRVMAATVDLAAPWTTIRDRLLWLVTH